MLFLTLATFSQTGGIQMVCRSLAKALDNISAQKYQPFRMISLCDAPDDLNTNYLSTQAFKAFSYDRLRFCTYVLRKSGSSGIIFLGHINLLPLAILVKALSPAIRIILVAHGKEVWGKITWLKKRFLSRYVEVWAVSRFTKTVLEERHKLPSHRIAVLNNCLDPFFTVPTTFEKPGYLLKRYNVEPGNKILLSITRLDACEKRKGYDLVIESLPALLEIYPNLRYLLAGNASVRERLRLRAKIEDLNLDKHVVLTGFISSEELTDHHLLADIFVLPSYKEGFGLVFLEAGVCGSKIIAGNQDGSADAVMESRLTSLVNPHSSKAISAEILRLLSEESDPVEFTLQQTRVIKNFSFEKYQSTVNSLLNGAQ